MKDRIGKKGVVSLTVLGVVLVAVFAGAGIIEKKQRASSMPDQTEAQSATLSEKEARLAETEIWTDENTVYFDGELYGFDHRIENYLFIGTDNSDKIEGATTGAMADFLLLMVIDHTDDRYGFLQIDRNTVTEIEMLNDKGEPADIDDLQICTVHAYGTDPVQSAENTVEATRNLLGELEHIDGYYVLNVASVGTLNALVGGVDVTVPVDMTVEDPAMKKGATLKLTDAQAETFVRSRMALSDDTNAGRMARQRIYMNSFLKKALEKIRIQPGFVNTLWNTMQDEAVTNMSAGDLSRIAEAMRSNENLGILTLEGETRIGTILGDGEKHEEFYPTTTSLVETMTELFALEHIEEEDDTEEDTEDDEDDTEDEAE